MGVRAFHRILNGHHNSCGDHGNGLWSRGLLAAELYVFTDDVKSSGNGSVTGGNITMLMAAGHTIDLTANVVSLSAATIQSATNQQLPGIVFASSQSGNHI
jgi:hypothetical protein